jgi:four helix bundle protein
VITSFEELGVYQLGRELRRRVWVLTNTLPKDERYVLSPQMRRAALSVTNNIAEGFGRFHFQENIHFCFLARGSVHELLDDFIACTDAGYITHVQYEEHKTLVSQLLKALNGYIASQRRQKARHAF